MAPVRLLSFLRRVLLAWVRLRLLPAVPPALEPAWPVCYVLREDWLADRLVLREAVARYGWPAVDRPLIVGRCRLASADFALMAGWRPAFRARRWSATPPRLRSLVEAVLADAAADVQLVPVSIFWGRAPRQQDGILRALLAESWQGRQLIGHWLALLIHGRQTHVHFGPPLSLRRLVAGAPEPGMAAKKAARVLRVHFRRQRETMIGPDVSHRHTQVEALLASTEVTAAVAAEAARTGIPFEVALARARRHALAIASDYSYAVMRAAELFLTWVWTRLFDGVAVQGIERVLALAPGHTLVYLPCHRSHIDYLLMSYVLYRAGLAPPHIAAGDNLDLPVLGRLLRGGGAFFLRRSFKGDPLYASVFAAYLDRLLAQGFPLEYFIEGGRSRSGRLLPPKAGLLSMTIHSFLRHPRRPLAFIPVYLGYEKLPEGKSYLDELAGKPKERESLLGLLAALRVLRRHFGRVHVGFGEPLLLAEWLDDHCAGWRQTPPAEQTARAVVQSIAFELACRINEAASVNAINLVALALLASPHRKMARVALARMIDHLAALVEAQRRVAPARADECIEAALRLGLVHSQTHPLGALIAADELEAGQLAYFRNNVLHLYALTALAACLVIQLGPVTRTRLLDTLTDLYGPVRSSLYLRLEEAELPDALGATIERLAARGLIVREGDMLREPAANASERADLHWLASILRPQMERYCLVLMVLRHAGSGHATRVELIERSVLLAQRMVLMEAGKTPEFADKPLFVALTQHLIDNGILREDGLGRIHFDEALERAATQAEALLTPEARALMARLTAPH